VPPMGQVYHFDSPGRLKIEWTDYIYKNREKAKMDIFKYIKILYNPFAGKHNHKNKFDLLQN
jgi:hypothetical protein